MAGSFGLVCYHVISPNAKKRLILQIPDSQKELPARQREFQSGEALSRFMSGKAQPCIVSTHRKLVIFTKKHVPIHLAHLNHKHELIHVAWLRDLAEPLRCAW